MQRARSQPRRLSKATPLLPTQLLMETHATSHGWTQLPGNLVSYLRYTNGNRGLRGMAERDRLDHKLSVNMLTIKDQIEWAKLDLVLYIYCLMFNKRFVKNDQVRGNFWHFRMSQKYKASSFWTTVFGLVIKEITQANHNRRENCNKPIANTYSAGKLVMTSHVALGFFLIGRESGASFVVVVSRVSLLSGHKGKDPGNKASFP